MPNEAKQRFLALDVGEISLVDTPANELEFLVTKRLEEDEEMAAKTNKPAEVETAKSQGNDPEAVELQADGGSTDAVTKALAAVADIVKSIAPAAKPAAVAPAPAPAAETPDVRANVQKSLEGNGVTGEALAAAMAAYDASVAKAKPAEAAKPEESAPVTKAQADVVEEALDGLVSAVTKAKKFTPKRQAALKAAVDTLGALLAEVSSEEAPAAGNPATQIADSSVSKSASPDMAAVLKAIADIGEQVKKGLEETVTTTKALTDRVENIEKARAPSTVLPTEETEQPKPVTKSLWSGIL